MAPAEGVEGPSRFSWKDPDLGFRFYGRKGLLPAQAVFFMYADGCRVLPSCWRKKMLGDLNLKKT